MSSYKINLKFELGREAGKLIVSKPKNGDRAKASGFTKDVHGWGAEIHLLHLIRKRLEDAGVFLARKLVQGDKEYCHMCGDSHMCYLRTPIKRKGDMPHFWIVDGEYAVRSSATSYNAGEDVTFLVQGDIFQKDGEQPLQPDWWEQLHDRCVSGGIPCELDDELKREAECSITQS